MRHTTTARAKPTGPTSVIILAAEHTGRPNRSLYKVDGEPILLKQLSIIRNVFPVCEIIGVVGSEASRFFDFPCKFVENERWKETNVIRDVCLALRVASYQNILLINNNICFNEAAIDIFSNESRVLVKSDRNKAEVGCVVQDNVLSFVYGAEPRWEDITFICYKDMPILKDYCSNKLRERQFLHEGLNKIVDRIKISPVEPLNAEVIKYDTPRSVSD